MPGSRARKLSESLVQRGTHVSKGPSGYVEKNQGRAGSGGEQLGLLE